MRFLRVSGTTIAVFSLLVVLQTLLSAQGYFIDTTVVLPVQTVTTKSNLLSMTLAREDVRSIGMGGAQIANTRLRNAMGINPAFLANRRTTVDILNLQVGIPGQTLTATDFIKANQKNFSEGLFLKEIKAGITDFNNAVTPAQYEAAILRMNRGLQFITDLVDDVSGGEENPLTHGLRAIPSIQAQFGNIGFSLMSIAQTGFQVSSGRALESLKNFRVPNDLSDPQAIAEALQTLVLTVDALYDDNGEIAHDALPAVTALSYVDIIGTAGFGTQLTPELAGGVNLKVVNRRFSTSRIPADNLQDLISETISSFQASVTGVTLDAGLLYTLPQTGTRIAFTAENILPMKTIQSDMDVSVVETFIANYAYSSPGQKKVVNGDTGLVAARVPITVIFPFELKAPMILSIGAQHAIASNWDVAVEWTDMTSQNNLYDKFLQRVRFGTEYRLQPLGSTLGLALRAGFAKEHLTAGLGVEILKIVALDGAIAYDNFTAATSYYAQLRIGW